jgi:hypothetical protein
MKIYELLIDENDLLLSGVNAISIVENPAIGSDFIALGDQKPILLAEVDKDRQILMGAALIPSKPIYRKDGDEEYYVYFSKETIAKTAEAFFRNNNQNNATLEHAEVLNNMTVFESWIVEDPEFDKSKKYGLDVPEGTWIVSMKVDDKDVWDNYVKDNKVFGFSIEGKFANVLRKEKSDMNFSDQVLDGTLELIKQFLKDNY